MSAEAPDSGPRRRLPIEERAARRDRMTRANADRYQSLLWTLRAGRELPWARRRSVRLEWHPIAWALLRVAIVGVVIYAVVSTGLSAWREVRVDTWTGPDATVTSGQRLESCPIAVGFRDPIFPAWVRFEGSIYRGTDSIRPIGSNLDNAYPDTGYSLGDLHLLRVVNVPAGQEGQMIVIKLESSLTGELYVRVPECR